VHSERQLKQLAKSIRTFGFVQPVLIDGARRVLAGHGRIEAAKLLGLHEVPTISVRHLSEPQLRALVIADNRLAEQASWNEKLLGEQLKFLSQIELDFDLEATGFEVGEIDLLIEGLSPAPAGVHDPADEATVSAASVTVTRRGDLWLAGPHRMYCGNSLEQSSFSNLMEGRKAAAVFVDPPFNVKIDGSVGDLGRGKHREFAMPSGEMSRADFIGLLTLACRFLVANSTDGSLHYVCMDWRHLGELLSASRKVYVELEALCVWDKGTGGKGSIYRSQHELIFVFKNGKAPHRNNIREGQFDRSRADIWDYPGLTKPVDLVADAITDCTTRGEIVLDTFLGSGTTVLAAERTGRICYGIEIDPVYVDAAVRRWQKFTGHEAVNAASSRTFNELEEEAAHEPRE